MMITRIVNATLVALTVLCLAAPIADGQHIGVDDARRDTIDPGLDFTHVIFGNRDRAIVVRFTFVRDRPSDVIVAVRVRGRGPAALVVSKHRRTGEDHLIFQTRHSDNARCKGLRSSWDRAAAQLRIRLPSRCVLRGNYGAIKSWALTEGVNGNSDADYAPETRDGSIRWTAWIPRG